MIYNAFQVFLFIITFILGFEALAHSHYHYIMFHSHEHGLHGLTWYIIPCALGGIWWTSKLIQKLKLK